MKARGRVYLALGFSVYGVRFMEEEFDEVSLPEDFDDSTTIGTVVAYQVLALRFLKLFKYRLPLIQHDNVKGALNKLSRRNAGTETTPMYPFFHVSISSTGLKEDAHIPKNIAKWGSGFTVTPEDDNAMGTKHYTFWSETTFEFTAEFNDFISLMKFADTFAIALAAKSLSSGAKVDNEEWTVVITGPSQISIPKATTEDEARPKVYQVTHQITVYSHIGELKDVPKVNNEGRMTTNIAMANK